LTAFASFAGRHRPPSRRAIRSYLHVSGMMSEGPAVDHREFREAVETDFARIPFDELLADTGYKYERHHVLIREELKARSPIPPRIERPSNRPPLGQSRRQFARQFPRRRFRLRRQIESGP
jgi:hypothetical protein